MEIGVYEKSLDFQGRVVFPAALREKFKDFMMFVYRDYVKLVPKKPSHKISDFFDSVEVDELPADYKEFRRNLSRKKYG